MSIDNCIEKWSPLYGRRNHKFYHINIVIYPFQHVPHEIETIRTNARD